MPYTYKDGYREGVVFAFINDNKILVEYRPVEEGTCEVFFTSGSIEDKDYIPNSNYKLVAMLREVKEEFEGKVKVNKYVYLDELKVEAINVVFYIYLILEWEGCLPEYTTEEGKKFAKLEWIKLEDKNKCFNFESAFEICRRIEGYLHKG